MPGRYPASSNGPPPPARETARPHDRPLPPTAAPSAPSQKRGLVGELVEIVKTVVYALLIALVLRVLLFQPYTIPSASMEPNLYRGDYIIVTK